MSVAAERGRRRAVRPLTAGPEQHGPAIARKLCIANVGVRSWRQTTAGRRRSTALGDVRRFMDLPERARAYVQRLEALIEVPIRWVSFGPRREQLLER